MTHYMTVDWQGQGGSDYKTLDEAVSAMLARNEPEFEVLEIADNWDTTRIVRYKNGVCVDDHLVEKTPATPDPMLSLLDELGYTPKTKLVILDADGTLVDRATGEFLPGVESILATDREIGRQFAIATNQGGPACAEQPWAKPGQFPTLAAVEARYSALAERVGAKLYMCLAYVTKRGDVLLPSGLVADDPRTRLDWRKPAPGMLLQAVADFGVTPAQTLMVGDSEDDKAAAEAAGVEFMWAHDYFKPNPDAQRAEFAAQFRTEGDRVFLGVSDNIEYPNAPALFVERAARLAREQYNIPEWQAREWAIYTYEGFVWPFEEEA